MKRNTAQKSSFTLPANELPLVAKLRERLHLKSNTEVVRRALYELKSKTDRGELRRQFREASILVRSQTKEELEELDHLASEGL